MRKIDTIFIHCSASDYPHHDDVSVIRKWHVDERGFSDVGYHYFITKAGQTQLGRPVDVKPAAQKGFNTGSVAICLSGEYEFTEAQFRELRRLVGVIKGKYNITAVRGHNEVDKGKTCPNFDVKAALKEKTLLERLKLWLYTLG